MSLEKARKHGKEKKVDFQTPKRVIRNPPGFSPGKGGKMNMSEVEEILIEEDSGESFGEYIEFLDQVDPNH
jgi:hypothetical protein